MRYLLQRTNVVLFMFVMLAFANNGMAQNADIPFDDLPPVDTYGKCYAKCKIADVYETVSVEKLVKEASTKLSKVPEVWETATEQVLDKEGRTEYKTVPATYKTLSEQVEVVPAKTKVRTIPAKYRTESRKVMVSEARGEWVKKKKSPNCFSNNPEDCYVVCYEEVPAVYRTETFQVLETAAATTEETIPAVYKTVTRRVIDTPARVEEVIIPAQYKTISKKVLVSPETVTEQTIPAVYKTISEKRLVSKGGYTVWTEILCPSKTGNSQISAVQRALRDNGYDAGPIDGVLGVKTQTALKQFQTDKSLPIGNLNIQTLAALGIEG